MSELIKYPCVHYMLRKKRIFHTTDCAPPRNGEKIGLFNYMGDSQKLRKFVVIDVEHDMAYPGVENEAGTGSSVTVTMREVKRNG
jgi:hypothetical protein